MSDIAYQIKEESPAHYVAIRRVTKAAFAPMSFSSGAEPNIIETLRAEGDLSLSLVALGQASLLGTAPFHRPKFRAPRAIGMRLAYLLYGHPISANVWVVFWLKKA